MVDQLSLCLECSGRSHPVFQKTEIGAVLEHPFRLFGITFGAVRCLIPCHRARRQRLPTGYQAWPMTFPPLHRECSGMSCAFKPVLSILKRTCGEINVREN